MFCPALATVPVLAPTLHKTTYITDLSLHLSLTDQPELRFLPNRLSLSVLAATRRNLPSSHAEYHSLLRWWPLLSLHPTLWFSCFLSIICGWLNQYSKNRLVFVPRLSPIIYYAVKEEGIPWRQGWASNPQAWMDHWFSGPDCAATRNPCHMAKREGLEPSRPMSRITGRLAICYLTI